MEESHTPLVETPVFDAIQAALQRKVFNISARDTAPSTDNILKGKVICGNCGSKMQRRRGTNHANWYFFTCLTNNRVGAERCTGIYVREEDVFSAIYYQFKQWIDANFISNSEYADRKSGLEDEITQLKDFSVNPVEKFQPFYEQLVLGEITSEQFRELHTKAHNAEERLDVVERELEKYKQQYQRFMRMYMVQQKELPLVEIMCDIEEIVIYAERKIKIKWYKLL